MRLARVPFPDKAVAMPSIEPTTLSLRDVSAMFNGRAISTIKRDCEFLGVSTHWISITKDDAWTIYVYLCWVQWKIARGYRSVRRDWYWQETTPEYLKDGEVSSVTSCDDLRLAFVAHVGNSEDHFNKLWSEAIERIKSKYQVKEMKYA